MFPLRGRWFVIRPAPLRLSYPPQHLSLILMSCLLQPRGVHLWLDAIYLQEKINKRNVRCFEHRSHGGALLLSAVVALTFLCLTVARQQQTLYTPGAGFT